MLADIAALATAVGVLIGACGVFAQARQRKLGLAQLYIERYWEISDDLSTEDTALNRSRYLALSEDEYEVVKLGWIDAGVWSVWHASITECAGKFADGQPTGHKLLDSCLFASTPNHAPNDCPLMKGRSARRRIAWRIERLLYG